MIAPVENLYNQEVARGTLKPDTAQHAAIRKLDALIRALDAARGFSLFRRRKMPGGLYIWGDVGRGKSMLMDMFFAAAPVTPKRRVHFNAFMADVHSRIHAARAKGSEGDPIPAVARAIAGKARLLCFDEFQVGDVADAMILGRLFEQFFAAGMTIVATSNTPPDRLYKGGLNRQLFLPFIAELEARLEVVALNGPTDYRLERIAGLNMYLTPLGPAADMGMDAAWKRLTDTAEGKKLRLALLGRVLTVPHAAKGVARFTFAELCEKPLAAPDYLAIAQHFHTVLIDHIPLMDESKRNEARRFILLLDTLYDNGVKLICSAAAPPDALYPKGDGADAFRRAASRLADMASDAYLRKGHGLHRLSSPASEGLAGEVSASEPARVADSRGREDA